MKSEEREIEDVEGVEDAGVVFDRTERSHTKAPRRKVRSGEARWNVKSFAALRLGVRILLNDFYRTTGSKMSKVAKMSRLAARELKQRK